MYCLLFMCQVVCGKSLSFIIPLTTLWAGWTLHFVIEEQWERFSDWPRSWTMVSIRAGFELGWLDCMYGLCSSPMWVASKCLWLLMVFSVPEYNYSFFFSINKKDLLKKNLEYVYENINSDYLCMVKYEWFLFSFPYFS